MRFFLNVTFPTCSKARSELHRSFYFNGTKIREKEVASLIICLFRRRYVCCLIKRQDISRKSQGLRWICTKTVISWTSSVFSGLLRAICSIKKVWAILQKRILYLRKACGIRGKEALHNEARSSILRTWNYGHHLRSDAGRKDEPRSTW